MTKWPNLKQKRRIFNIVKMSLNQFGQCDQIWRNFVTLGSFWLSLSNGWGFVQCLVLENDVTIWPHWQSFPVLVILQLESTNHASFLWTNNNKCKLHTWLGSQNSSVVSSVLTIMQPRVRIPSTPSTLLSDCIFEIVMRKGINKKEAGIGPFLVVIYKRRFFIRLATGNNP